MGELHQIIIERNYMKQPKLIVGFAMLLVALASAGSFASSHREAQFLLSIIARTLRTGMRSSATTIRIA